MKEAELHTRETKVCQETHTWLTSIGTIYCLQVKNIDP